ncbi:MAG: PID-CTERM protein-sorting domain-containing protein [Bacteroidota bacterium]
MIKSKSITGIIVFVVLNATVLYSAPTPPGGGNNPPVCWPPPCIPLDGGIIALAAAGIAYGFYKSRVLHKAPK